jgi:hypothetical protein
MLKHNLRMASHFHKKRLLGNSFLNYRIEFSWRGLDFLESNH